MTRFRPLLGLAAAALTSACEDRLFEQVCPEGITEVARSVPELRPAPVDILFVVDNSGSMREEQENLAANFEAFINALSGSNGSYRLAIITTDATGVNPCDVAGQECGGQVRFSFASSFPFERESVTGEGCFELDIPVTCFQADASGNTVIDSDTQTAAEINTSFQEAVQVGTCGDGIEVGLETMRLALTKARSGDMCNGGFLRDDANLVVVFVSDERGNSIPNADKQDGIQDEDMDEFVQALEDAKGDLSSVRVAAIVGAVDGDAAECRTGDTPTCGSLCDQIPDPLGSEQSCSSTNPCPSGEICTANGAPDNQRRCVAREWSLYLQGLEEGNPRACASCSNYATEDCCLAEPGDEYVAFTRHVGALASGAAGGRATCRSGEDGGSFCLVDSICQENFSETLDRIARELVAVTRFDLDPPADNPAGVRVRITQGGEVVRELENGVGFRVSEDGSQFEFLGGEGPSEDEAVDLFYTTERTVQRPLRGACVPTATTSTAS
jgi:hypothetical protein